MFTAQVEWLSFEGAVNINKIGQITLVTWCVQTAFCKPSLPTNGYLLQLVLIKLIFNSINSYIYSIDYLLIYLFTFG